MDTPPRLKLQYHQSSDSRGSCSDDVLLSSRGSHGISAGDVIEVYHPDDAHHALFLVSTLRDDVLTRDVISIEHTLAVTLKLQQHKSVCVRVIDRDNFDSITLDMVEFYFREQYLNRCDLYRFTQELLGSVLQVNKKVTLDDMRVQVGELWRKGEKYSCGFVGPTTRTVFRSLTALVQVFIQLSEEMWSFDEHGDLYFEKALKFLSKLSLRLWSDNGCSHNVTVILFTRVYLEGLPAVIQNRMHCNTSGHFFEDFYHVLVQNERFQSDEWKRVLTQLKLEFKVFQQGLLSHLWNRYPSLKKNNNNNNNLSFRITSAAEGNFLEAISVAMNLYSSYNVDRNCDRTGNMPLVITPGTGCFRVDSRLLKLTDQRVLHFGVGIDLICLGPQPLHSVPLFEVMDADRAKYVTPYWIDCSFFRSTHEMRCMGLGHPINRIQIFPSFETHAEKFNDVTSVVSSTLIGERLLENDSIASLPRDVTPIYQIIYPHPPEVPLLCELSAPQVDLSSTSDEPPHLSYRPQGTNHSPITTTTTSLSYLPNPTVSALHTTALDSRMNRDLSAGSHCSDSNTGSPDAVHSDADGSTPPPPQQSIPTEISISASKLIPQPSRSLRANLGRSTNSGASFPSNHEHRFDFWQNASNGRSLPPHLLQVTGGPARRRSDCLSGVAGKNIGSCRFTYRDRHWSFAGCTPQHSRSLMGPTREPPAIMETSTRSVSKLDAHSSSQPIHTSAIKSTGLPSHLTMYRRNPEVSTLFPLFQSLNPFDISGNQPASTVTAGQRCWAFTRPPDKYGVPIVPQRDCSLSFCLDSSYTVDTNLCKVWAAYFNFLREQTSHHGPGDSSILTSTHTRALLSAHVKLDTGHLTSTVQSSSGHRPSRRISLSERTVQSSLSSKTIPTSLGVEESGSHAPPLQPKMSDHHSPVLTSAIQQLLIAIQTCGSHRPNRMLCPEASRAHITLQSDVLRSTLELIGVDWKSICAPACLPTETDFFPDNASLKSEDYILHDYRVVPVGVTPLEWESTHDFERVPGLLYCRRQPTIREVFHEMVLQRLGHGFQLYCESTPSKSGGSFLSSPKPSSPMGSMTRSVAGSTKLARRSLGRVQTPSLQSERTDDVVRRSSPFTSRRRQRQQLDERSPRDTKPRQRVPSGKSSAFSSPYTVQRSQPLSITLRAIGVGLTLSAVIRTTGATVGVATKFPGKPSRSGSLLTTTAPSMYDKPLLEHRTSFRLSIGHLFHSISLEEDSITITSYRSRLDDVPIRLEYKYASRVPDSSGYSTLRTVFTNESAYTMNWSHLDNYLCTRGVSDSYGLIPSLKFFRSLFVLLPVFTDETKRLSSIIKERASDRGPRIQCDVYEAHFLAIDPYPLCEKFLHFIEFINRARRSATATRKLIRLSASDKPEFAQRPRDFLPTTEQPGVDKSKLLPFPTVTTPAPLNLASISMSGAETVITSVVLPPCAAPSSNALSTAPSTEHVACTAPLPSHHPPALLSSTCTPVPVVVTMMADPDMGLPFVTATNATVLPEHTFMSFDAVAWTIKWFSDVDVVPQAVAYLQTLLNSGWICHTSGNPSHAFVYGSYFYTLLLPDVALSRNTEPMELAVHSTPVTPNPTAFHSSIVTSSQSATTLSVSSIGPAKTTDVSGAVGVPPGNQPFCVNIRPRRFPDAFIPRSTAGPSGWTMDFQTDWAEVAFAHDVYTSVQTRVSDHDRGPTQPCTGDFLTYTRVPLVCGLSGRPGCHESDGVLRKTCVCDFDDPSADGRVEWAHCVYDANYHPCHGYSIELQWMVAAGARLSELINIWHHRASTNNFHFFPVPCFPFGYSEIRSDADPLRIPVFVPMDLTALLRHSGSYDQETSTSTQHSPYGSGTVNINSSDVPPSGFVNGECDPVVLASKLFPGDSCAQRIYALRSFQDYLLKRFGFLRHTYDPRQAVLTERRGEPLLTDLTQRWWIYVHCSGGMFVMIPMYRSQRGTAAHEGRGVFSLGVPDILENRGGPTSHAAPHGPQNTSVRENTSSSERVMPLEYSSKKCNRAAEIGDPDDEDNTCFREQSNVGYFWTWNHILPRRWRGHLTGDESFQDAMLSDFRAFMRSEDDRLVRCYRKYLEDLNSRFGGSDQHTEYTTQTVYS